MTNSNELIAYRLLILTGLRLFLFFCFAFASTESHSETRLALLISNSNYGEASSLLANSENDSRILAEELKRDGFEVQVENNLTKQDMNAALDRFKGKLKEGDTVLFYFSGIGLNYNRQSYIIPVNAEIWKESDIKRDGFSLDGILADLTQKGANPKIVIVDAARRNPFERNFRDGAMGLASIDTPPGSLIILSASPGKLAPESSRENSLFINELLSQIRQPVSAEGAFTRTRVNVANKSGGGQVPWVSSSLTSDFSFFRGGSSSSRAANRESGSRETVSQPPTTASAPTQTRESGVRYPAGSTFRDCDNCPELVVVDGGSFTMGSTESPLEKPPHTVKIDHSFAIGRYEVTLAEWDRCVEAGDCRHQPQGGGMDRNNSPAGDVSWDDANVYLKWLSKKTGRTYRLPTEAEWEYAARAGTLTPFWWGRAKGTGNANCGDCGADAPGKPSKVGDFKPNAFGLHDTAGNVAEWVQDCWNDSYKGAPSDGSAWLSGTCNMRVLRGGYFGSKAQSVRSAARFRYDSDVRYPGNGFRVVRELR